MKLSILLIAITSLCAFSQILSSEEYVSIRAYKQNVYADDIALPNIEGYYDGYDDGSLSEEAIIKKIYAKLKQNPYFLINTDISIAADSDGYVLGENEEETAGCGLTHELDKLVVIKKWQKLKVVDAWTSYSNWGGKVYETRYEVITPNGDLIELACVSVDEDLFEYVHDVAMGIGSQATFYISVKK